MTAPLWVACAAIGAGGALLRAETVAAATRRLGVRFPWGTMIVNLSGAFMLGLLHGAEVSHTALTLAGAAFLGSLTTFSTWMLETTRLLKTSFVTAAANVAGSLLAGVALAELGNLVGKAIAG